MTHMTDSKTKEDNNFSVTTKEARRDDCPFIGHGSSHFGTRKKRDEEVKESNFSVGLIKTVYTL